MPRCATRVARPARTAADAAPPCVPAGYFGSAPVSDWSSVVTGASGLFGELLPECGVTDRLGAEPIPVPTELPTALTTVAV